MQNRQRRHGSKRPGVTETYLAPWRWVSDAEGERWEFPVSGAVGCIDLRPLPAQAAAGGVPQGYGLFAYPAPVVIPGGVHLGNDLGRNLSPTERDGLKSRLLLPERAQGAS